MNNKKSLVPKLRFPEFIDVWEQRALAEYIKTSTRKNLDNKFTKNDVLSVSGDVGIVNQIEFQGRSFAGVSVSNYRIVNTGDIVYTKSPLKANPYGIIKTNKGKAGIVSTLYAIYTPNQNTDSIFIQYYFEFNDRLNRYLKPLVNKGAKNDMKVSDNNALIGNVIFPKIQEQQKIGSFFTALDRLISAHQRKLENVRKLKKSLLQKMFPKNGQEFPEIRFPEFTDVWEQRKLGFFIQDYVEKTTIQNQYPVLTSSQKQGIVLQEDYFADRQITNENNIGYFVLPKGFFTYRSRSDNGIFCFNRNDLIDKGIISYFYPVFEIINGDSNFFLCSLNSTIDKQVALEAEGTGQRVLSLKKFKNINIIVPIIEEQQKIGTFFTALDRLISTHQRKLDNMKKLKKALLQQMFV